MKTQAAFLVGPHQDWEVGELELDEPKAGEVLLRMVTAGLCHSDEHLRQGEMTPRFPMVGGHEGSGVVEALGSGVTRVEVGDHVVCSFIPSCGICRYCATGHQNLCDMGALLLEGCLPDHTFRFHRDGEDFGAMCMLGTFSEYTVVSQLSCVRIPNYLNLETAALVSCGVPTGWGAAVHRGEVKPGDTVVIYGIGGIGMNAVQGARHAGARHVVVVDRYPSKAEAALKFGATHACASAEEAQTLVTELTYGQLADVSIVTVGVVDEEVCDSAFSILGKGGIMVIVGLASPEARNMNLSSFFLVNYERQVRGSLFGTGNPYYDIPNLLKLYEDGEIKLDELISRRYSLTDVNLGYRDMEEGRILRGVITFDS